MSDETGSVGLVETRQVRLVGEGAPMRLESGAELGPIDVAYECYGELNAEGDNAILICHALSGDAHAAGRHSAEDRKSGWWDRLIGPGKAFDTDRYFVICSNCLGGCRGTTGPGSLDPRTGEPYGLTFPFLTISDMVDVQVRLVDHLGIDRLLAVAGGSMGGMQVLDWAVRYPERVTSAIPIATTGRLSAQAIAFDAVGRHAILSDPGFQQGQYYHQAGGPRAGLAVARMVGHITYLSEEAMHEKFGRSLQEGSGYQYGLSGEFSVESYLDYQGSSFVDRFDANSYLYFTKAMDYFDLALAYGGELAKAMAGVKGRFLVISFDSDWLFPARQSRELVESLTAAEKEVSYCNITCPYGHDSFLLEDRVQSGLIEAFLRQSHCYRRIGRCCQAPQRPTANSPVESGSKVAMAGEPCCRFGQDEAGAETAKPPGAPSKSPAMVTGARIDYEQIAALVPAGSTVLDLGCGDGELLRKLRHEKGVQGVGVTLDEQDIVSCIGRCVNILQYDLDEGLGAFKDGQFKTVILSQTLPMVRRPRFLLDEMLRVGQRAVVSIPNYSYWRVRWHMLLKGALPRESHLPYEWHEQSRINYLTIRDFEWFVAERLGARLVQRIALSSRSGQVVERLPHWLADEVIFVLQR